MVLGVEMLDEDEGHPGIWREMADQFGYGFDAACGSADGDDSDFTLRRGG